MICIKKGQRWLWSDSTIVEILEDVSFEDGNYSVTKCKIVQIIKEGGYGPVGKISDWSFGAYMKYWTYLQGQDSPCAS